MMKIRKHEGVWEMRELVMNSFKWYTCKNLEDLQESIVRTAVHLDHYTKMALEIIQGTSEIYIYENGELTRLEPLGKVFCLTPFLQQRCTLITLIKFIESGIWRPRTWKTPESLSNFSESSIGSEKVKKQYLILETTDENYLPYDVDNLFSVFDED